MARHLQAEDTQIATDAFRDLVGWFPRSGKAVESLWVQHQGILADERKLAKSEQNIDVIFLQAGDPLLARVKDLNVEVLQPDWISESLKSGSLALAAPFRLTGPPQAFPARSLPPSPQSQSAHADDTEHANAQSIEQDAEVESTDPRTQQSNPVETFPPNSQTGYKTGLFAYSAAPAAIKVESPPSSFPPANQNVSTKLLTHTNPEDTDITNLTNAPAASIPPKVSLEEKMEGIRKSIEDLSAKQGIKPPIKRERYSPVIPSKPPSKVSTSTSSHIQGDWRAHTAAAIHSLNEDNKSYIRSYSTRRGRSMSFKQEDDEVVLAMAGTPLSMRRKAPYSRNSVNQTSVYHNNTKAKRVLLSPIKIKNTSTTHHE